MCMSYILKNTTDNLRLNLYITKNTRLCSTQQPTSKFLPHQKYANNSLNARTTTIWFRSN